MTKPSGPISIVCGYNSAGEVVPVLIDADGALVTAGGATTVDAADVTYTPAVAADWNGGVDPGDQNQANDQLAERVKDLEVDTVGNLLPVRASWFHDANFIVAGAALIHSLTANYRYYSAFYQNPGALNDQFLNSAVLKAGAYTIAILGITNTNQGQLKIEFKHVSDVGYSTIVAAQEWYAGAANYNVIKTQTFTVTIPGRHLFRFTVASKNAASSGYYLLLTKFDIYLTAGDS